MIWLGFILIYWLFPALCIIIKLSLKYIIAISVFADINKLNYESTPNLAVINWETSQNNNLFALIFYAIELRR